VASWSNTQTFSSGNALVNGDITAGTSDSSATLEVTEGDLVINGSITTLSETSLNIYVPSGTVFLHGLIKTGRTDGVADGESSGNVVIIALRIIFTGTIDTRGEDNPAGNGGFGGSVDFCTDPDGPPSGIGQTSQLMVGGTFLMYGGNGAGPSSRGGSGGNFQTSRSLYDAQGGHYAGSADGTVYVSGTTINVDGGSASGTGEVFGGSSGFVYWMADSGFFFNGVLSGVGGSATSSDGEAVGGTGTGVFVNEFSIGDSGPISIFGVIDISGGSAACGASTKCVGAIPIPLPDQWDEHGKGARLDAARRLPARGGEGGGVSFVIPDGVPGTSSSTAISTCPAAAGWACRSGPPASSRSGRTWSHPDHGFARPQRRQRPAPPLTSGPSDGGLVHVQTGDGDASTEVLSRSADSSRPTGITPTATTTPWGRRRQGSSSATTPWDPSTSIRIRRSSWTAETPEARPAPRWAAPGGCSRCGRPGGAWRRGRPEATSAFGARSLRAEDPEGGWAAG
jgi:hypothetical protein